MNYQGPEGDYAVILMRNTGNVYDNWDVGNKPYYERITGPFRIALWQDASNFRTWLPRDSMAWWQDGNSNQLIVGEKHIPAHQLGKCTETQKSGAELDDCSYLMSGHWKTVMSARSFQNPDGSASLPITRGPSDPVADPITVPTANGLFNYGFGSSHSSICNFLLGDGSVRSVSVTTSPENILIPLACVNDGVSVTLP
jgi:hypothetical protein